eukprot:PhF_6_TR22223/c1_g1_i1/m.31383/K07179/RIOK2; RIO kinase 2
MVKLNASLLQYLEEDDFRVLSALELAIRNHELVPAPLIERIANLARGGANKRLKEMLKYKLIHHDRTLYDGYAMKYAAYDYLALHVFSRRGVLSGIGNMVGCGKESDIYLGCDADGNHVIVKLERLGRCSFRSVARNRAYTKSGKRGGASWFYLSRLAATKEFAFLQALYEEGYPVPKPIDHNRHAIVMEKIDGCVLTNVDELRNPTKVFYQCMDVLVRLACNGLIHGDFNEFNLMIKRETEDVVVIDFPQMVSTKHKNAAEFFERDVKCIHNYFQRKYKLHFDYWPRLDVEGQRTGNLDSRIAQAKFTEAQQSELDRLAGENAGVEGDNDSEDGEEEVDLAPKDKEGAEEEGTGDEEDEEEGEEDDEEEDEEQEEGTTPTAPAEARPKMIAVLTKPTVNVKQIRTRVQRENGKKSLNDLKNRTMHRNQFKSKDKRRVTNDMKQMREMYYGDE